MFLAVAIMAAAAAGTPNIMQGKKPDMYMPRLQVTSALVLPAQKLVRSPRPMVSNQNHVVQSVVHADGDQQAVEEGVQARADGAHAGDAVAQGNQSAEHQRPDEQQDDRSHDGNHRSGHGHEALAAEEGQEVRQLHALEAVVGPCADQAAQDADEGVGDLAESQILGGALDDIGHDGADHTGAQQLLDHQPGSQAGQSRGAVRLVGHAYRNADDEQDLHIVDQGAAGLDQQEADDLCQALDGAALHGGRAQRVADAHQ